MDNWRVRWTNDAGVVGAEGTQKAGEGVYGDG
jgi:hypothetical protein